MTVGLTLPLVAETLLGGNCGKSKRLLSNFCLCKSQNSNRPRACEVKSLMNTSVDMRDCALPPRTYLSRRMASLPSAGRVSPAALSTSITPDVIVPGILYFASASAAPTTA
ncbi:hypothetical protein BV20DRAFT_469955 [Pilatotrama ljubarskyi]|nr:hypothetical protein BV20DRAFT_469955 [Pilatotrama ljubarskyi]